MHCVKRSAYTKRMKLKDYLERHGAKTKLANVIGAQPQLVWQWASGVRNVPVDRCYSIEQATDGAVTRIDLRPDDWQTIWPELAAAHTQQPQPATECAAQEA